MTLSFPRTFGDVFNDPFFNVGDWGGFGTSDWTPSDWTDWSGWPYYMTTSRRTRRRNRRRRVSATTSAGLGYGAWELDVDRANLNFWRHYDEPVAVLIEEKHDGYNVLVYPNSRVDPSSLNIEVRDDMLVIKGHETVEVGQGATTSGGGTATTTTTAAAQGGQEKQLIKFERLIQLPIDVDEDNIKACMKDNRLTICIPKREEHATKRVQIEGKQAAPQLQEEKTKA